MKLKGGELESISRRRDREAQVVSALRELPLSLQQICAALLSMDSTVLSRSALTL